MFHRLGVENKPNTSSPSGIAGGASLLKDKWSSKQLCTELDGETVLKRTAEAWTIAESRRHEGEVWKSLHVQ